MYLQRLEIQGFKSFADKVDLHFNPGVTIVVGPNGSGKSNIGDAIRWVLGEQSAKSLRGTKMEDIIFSGSDKRRPVGMAEVALTLDNSNGVFPLEFNEVTVARRVFRSGESEFLINKVACRLKDIHELFMDTGIGKETYSIIGQGKIEEILSAKSEDRRVLIEEAAGIIKYRNRKQEATRKLMDTEQNLLRILDIIAELDSQVEPLREQAEKAEAFLKFKGELRELEVNLFVHQVEEQKAKLALAREEAEGLQRDLLSQETSLVGYESKEEELKWKLNQADEKISALQQAVYELANAMERVESKIGVSRERERGLEEQLQRLVGEIEDIKAKEARLKDEYAGEEQALAKIQLRIKETTTRLAAEEAGLEQLRAGIKDEEASIEGYKGDIIDLMNEIANNNNGLKGLEIEKNNALRRLAQLAEAQELAQADLARLEDDLAQGREAKEALNRNHEELQERGLSQQASREELDGQLYSIRSQVQEVQEKLYTQQSRLQALSDLKDEYEGYHKGVREVLLAHKRGSSEAQGVLGVVAEIIQVPDQYEKALEVFLGNNLQNIVTETDEDARKAIEYLKKGHLGRATFLPLNTVQPQPLREDEKEALRQPEAIGLAAELVNFEPKFRSVVNYLLGRLIVVKDIAAAVKIARKAKYRVRLVTLDGDLIQPGGSLSGGSMSKQGSGLLARNREIQQLQGQVEGLNKSYTDLQREEKQLQGRLEQLTAEIAQLQEQYQLGQLKLNDLERNNNQLTAEYERITRQQEILVMEDEQFNQTIAGMEETKAKLTAEQNSLQKTNDEIKAEIARSQSELQGVQQQVETIAGQITQLKVDLAALKQEEIGLGQTLARFHQSQAEFSQEIHGKEQDIALLVTQKSDLRLTEEEHREELKGYLDKKTVEEEVLAGLRQERHELAANLGVVETGAKQSQKKINELQGRINSTRVKEARLEMEVENGLNRLFGEYELSYEQALLLKTEITNRRAVTTRIQDLKGEINFLGAVNLAAIEEYARVKERFEFLTAQHKDLEEAKDSLYKVIGEMDAIMTKRFGEAFAIINANFTEVFSQLFGGGRAELVLTDAGNLLETGIDIIAQPPGKKPQHLSLLSGGERALTAIALLFAILKAKPSPFCVLDEIEASLDEANVTRFADFLKDFSGKTQFIVVSHRKGTMEVADVLYGVTMDETGVSKLVSMQLSESKEKAS